MIKSRVSHWCIEDLGVSKLMVPPHATAQSSEMLLLKHDQLAGTCIDLMY
jgi:hypothetical protein